MVVQEAVNPVGLSVIFQGLVLRDKETMVAMVPLGVLMMEPVGVEVLVLLVQTVLAIMEEMVALDYKAVLQVLQRITAAVAEVPVPMVLVLAVREVAGTAQELLKMETQILAVAAAAGAVLAAQVLLLFVIFTPHRNSNNE